MFITIYQTYPVPSQPGLGRTFSKVATDIVFGCLVPFVVCNLHLSPARYLVLMGADVRQAMYPTIIIVLVALRRSPVDNGGLSQVVVQAYDADPVGDGIPSPVVFHLSASHNSAIEETEGTVEGIPADEDGVGFMQTLQSSAID